MIRGMRWLHAGRIVSMAVAALLFAAAGASAQDSKFDEFTLSKEAAKHALTRAEVNLDTAQKIVNACVDFAKEHDMTASVFVVNPTGVIIASARMDGQMPNNTNTALYKAQTAAYMRASTHATSNRLSTDVQRITRTRLNLWLVPGGLPIIVDDQVIGAVGVGGSRMDEQCAYEALTKVLGPQPPLEKDKPKPASPQQ
jgi:glc operon protein GlcG